MLINTIEELRLYFPAHAMDRIDGIAGFVDNSEHDFLVEKIGDALYSRLTDYYAAINPQELAETVRLGSKQDYYTELLLCCQRCIVFDAFSRAISVHAVSINDMGVNTATADDYGKADKDSIDAFKQTCTKEALAAVNRLLVTLEKWTREDAALGEDVVLEDSQLQRREIVKMWRMSRYFFLAASLLIPSAMVLQEYVNIYDSREKFIQLLPALRYIQEEKIEPALGEDMTEHLVDAAVNGTEDKVLCRIIHTLRKAMAAYLEERTTVLKVSADRKKEAHDEAERMMKRVVEYTKQHYSDLPEDIVKTLPFYKSEECVCKERLFDNNDHKSVIFVTPALN